MLSFAAPLAGTWPIRTVARVPPPQTGADAARRRPYFWSITVRRLLGERTRIGLSAFLGFACSVPCARAQAQYHTENVVVAVMDGTAWRQTFGDPEHKYIPRLWNELRPQGTLFTHFYNNDVTVTKAGHSTLMTGTWQKSRNRGPRATMPEIWSYLADETPLSAEKAFVVFGKGPYAFDSTTSFPGYSDVYKPTTVMDVGESSLRGDQEVFQKIMDAMEKDRPRIILANFGGTDHMAHSGHWDRHIKAIQHQDELLTDLWKRIQANPAYRDKTTLFLTNDHGYHLDGQFEGFAEHGDSCVGCRHIMLLALGPDFKKGAVVEKAAYQIDVAPTIGELLGVQTPLARGEVLKDAFVGGCLGLNRKEARTELAKGAVRLEALAAGNLVKHVADDVLARSQGKPIPPTPEGAMLLWGMLSAYDKTDDARYLDFVRAWGQQHMDATSPSAGLVLAELAYRLDDATRPRLLAAARRIAEIVAAQTPPQTARSATPDFFLGTILLASVGEATREKPLWLKAEESLAAYLRAADFELGEAAAIGVENPVAFEKAEDIVRKQGKVVPVAQPTQGAPDNSWVLLAVAYVRSHGLPLKGEYFDDVPDLRAEALVQTYRAVKELPRAGEVWPGTLQAALNVAAIKELQKRKDVFREFESLGELELMRLRPRSPEVLPDELDIIKREIRLKVTATNYNVEYGFPHYREFDYSIDLLRLYSDRVKSDLETGAFLLALDPQRRVGFEPYFASPRD